MIVYPMGLPPYDPVRMEFENKEDLSGTQVCGSRAFCGFPSPQGQSPSDLTLLFRIELSASSMASHLVVLCLREEF